MTKSDRTVVVFKSDVFVIGITHSNNLKIINHFVKILNFIIIVTDIHTLRGAAEAQIDSAKSRAPKTRHE